jgi:hypothetical protein
MIKRNIIITMLVLLLLLTGVSISYAQFNIGFTGGWNFPFTFERTDIFGMGTGTEYSVKNNLLDKEDPFWVGGYFYFSGSFHYMLSTNAGIGINAGYTSSRWVTSEGNDAPETAPPGVLHIYADFMFELPIGNLLLSFHGGTGASYFMYARNVFLVGYVDYGGIGFGFKGGVNVMTSLTDEILIGLNVDAHYFFQKTHIKIDGGSPEENTGSSVTGFFLPISLYLGIKL